MVVDQSHGYPDGFLLPQVGSDQLWKLLTIYEIQVASQLPRRQNRDARAVGCTGVACASSCLLGQTEEVIAGLEETLKKGCS
jgi:hypothetical protein